MISCRLQQRKKNEFISKMHWRLIIALVSAFGVIKEFRPATSFLIPYLISSPKNFTNVQLYSEIYPFWTYSYLVALANSILRLN
uniref:Mannosyltransferase n=1 Tax=Elaeophora elaphi TaxID=1147741 RepID=A0A0R3RUY3_9BILA